MDKVAFEKLAAARDSEVRGVMAAFVDKGLVKVASEEAFFDLCDVVSDNIGFDYDLQKIAAVTDAVIAEANGEAQEEYIEAGQEKTAEEAYYDNMASLGELLLMKTAGEISDADFVDLADPLIKEAVSMKGIGEGVKKAWGAVKGKGKAYIDTVSGKNWRSAQKSHDYYKGKHNETKALVNERGDNASKYLIKYRDELDKTVKGTRKARNVAAAKAIATGAATVGTLGAAGYGGYRALKD